MVDLQFKKFIFKSLFLKNKLTHKMNKTTWYLKLLRITSYFRQISIHSYKKIQSIGKLRSLWHSIQYYFSLHHSFWLQIVRGCINVSQVTGEDDTGYENS